MPIINNQDRKCLHTRKELSEKLHCANNSEPYFWQSMVSQQLTIIKHTPEDNI